jgi:hypothetical protein
MNLIEKLLKERMGFVKENEIPEIIKENRMQSMIVRCGGGRFICPVQDVQHFIDIIEKEKSDYIRDVSIYNKDYLIVGKDD